MERKTKILSLFGAVALFCMGPSVAHAAVLFSSTAESGICDTGVEASVWNYLESSDPTNSQMFIRCSTPISSIGHSKYFQVTTVTGQHGVYDIRNVDQINLSHGTTYYLGMFFRFDRINGADVWHDTDDPDSYDKYFEINGSIRLIFMAGWPNSMYSSCKASACDGKYTMGVYISCPGCDQDNDGGQAGCCAEKYHNVSTYSRTSPRYLDYGRWYAGVLAFNPSTDGSTNDGTVDFYINGTKVFHFAGVTQPSATPYVNRFVYTGTMTQPAYDAPPHIRKMDNFIFADSLTDIRNAGLMTDPETGSGDTTAPAAPTNLSVR